MKQTNKKSFQRKYQTQDKKQEGNNTKWSELFEILEHLPKETTSLQFSKFLDKTLETDSMLESFSFDVNFF
jgi:hypothetical protein